MVPETTVAICSARGQDSLQQAIGSVLRQSYTDFELLVVRDPGMDAAVEHLEDPRVRRVTSAGTGIGAARQTALESAAGRYLAWCDDDDAWEPEHLSVLVGFLHDHPDVDLVYADSLWEQLGSPPAVAYSMDFDATALSYDNFIFASDVVLKTAAGRAAGGFDTGLAAHEDWDLWLRLATSAKLRHVRSTLGRRRWSADALLGQGSWDTWNTVFTQHQARLTALGDVARHDLVPERARLAPFAPSTWSPPRRELIWHSIFGRSSGHGNVGIDLLRAVAGSGVDVTIAPTRNQPVPGVSEFHKPLDHWGRLGFYYDHRVRPTVLPVEQLVTYTMWESTAVPRDHVEEINRSTSLLLVPCHQNVEAFINSGVTVPVDVLHHGVDPSRFPILERPTRDTVTFGTFGTLSPRKGIDALIRAFSDEFAPSEPVRLVIKGTGSQHDYRVEHPSIRVVDTFLDDKGLLDFLGALDAFVMPSRGEGFGLCGLEAMATGLPLVATGWSGPTEYLDAVDSYPLDYTLVEAAGAMSNQVAYWGKWAEPDYEHLRATLRAIAEDPESARQRGTAAAERVHRHWTWPRMGAHLRDHLDRVGS